MTFRKVSIPSPATRRDLELLPILLTIVTAGCPALLSTAPASPTERLVAGPTTVPAETIFVDNILHSSSASCNDVGLL